MNNAIIAGAITAGTAALAWAAPKAYRATSSLAQVTMEKLRHVSMAMTSRPMESETLNAPAHSQHLSQVEEPMVESQQGPALTTAEPLAEPLADELVSEGLSADQPAAQVTAKPARELSTRMAAAIQAFEPKEEKPNSKAVVKFAISPRISTAISSLKESNHKPPSTTQACPEIKAGSVSSLISQWEARAPILQKA